MAACLWLRTSWESTSWGLDFFLIMPNKSTWLPGKYMPTRRVQTPGEHMLGPGIFLSCQIRVHDYPESKCHPESRSTRRAHAGAWNFFLITPNKSTCLPEEKAVFSRCKRFYSKKQKSKKSNRRRTQKQKTKKQLLKSTKINSKTSKH